MSTGRFVNFLALATIMTTGCATTERSAMEQAWREIQLKNTRTGYGEFIAMYPNAPQLADAKRRMQDPEYAFQQTCSIATKKAFEGFVNDHSDHPLATIARHRISFLDEVVEHAGWDGHWKFAVRHPDNPFAIESRTSIPLLWLRELRRPVAVVFQVRAADPYGMRRKLEKGMNDTLKAEGIDYVFIQPGTDAQANSNLTVAIVVCYNEAPGVPPPPIYPVPRPGPNQLNNIAAQSVGALAGAVVANILFGPPGPTQFYHVLYREPDGVFRPVYSVIPGLTTPAITFNRRLAIEALGGADEKVLQVILRGRQ